MQQDEGGSKDFSREQIDTARAEAVDDQPGGRVLGRGLEDVSHLFISESTRKLPSSDQRQPLSQPRRQAIQGRKPAIFIRSLPEASREQLVEVIKEQPGALEEGLQIIDAAAPCGGDDFMDLLGVDSSGRLAVIDLATEEIDSALLRGLSHIDWLSRNTYAARRMYQGHAIKFSMEPRLFFVTPHMPRRLQCAARQITCLKIDWIAYQAADVEGAVGILFNRFQNG